MAVSQFGNSTPWAKAVARLAAKEPAATVSSRNTMMPSEATSGYTPTQYASPVTQDIADTAQKWSLETDPLYRSAMASGQSAFNFTRNAALAEKQTAQTQLGQQRKATDTAATESRRRLAGNYAARGMAGGAAGALTQAEARANAEQIAAQTSIADQISALNNQFLQNFGDVTNANYDWTGTLTGQQYKTQAAQQALEAALGRYGTV